MDNKNKDDDDAMDVDAISAPPILLPSGPLEVSSSGSDASSEASDNDNNDNDDDASSSDTERPTSAVLAVSGTDDTIDEEDNTDDPMATTAANNPDNTNAAAVVQQPPPLPPPPPPRLLVAESYIYPTTVPLPALLVPGVAASLPGRPSRKAVAINDERAQPRVLHAHRLIRARHGGVLPAEFIVRRPGVDDDDDDDDDDDEDDDDGGSDSDQRTAGSSIGGQLDFFKALESKYANSSSNGKAKKRAPPRKRKDDNEWYDSADPFIDDAGEFDGNLGLMQPVRQGWFMCTGPVEVVPLYDDVVADSDDGGAGLPELAIVAPSISASGSVPAAKATKKQAASFSAEPSPVAAVGAATKRAGDSASAACATSPMAPSAAPTSAPAATTARRGKYMVLRTLDPPTPPGTPSESDREAVFAHLIKYVPTPVVAPLKTFRRLAAAADWTEKKVFPPTLKEPWYNATRAYWDASPTVPSGAFLHAVFVCMPYNLFTVKRYIARNFVERYVEEVVEQVMWVGLLQTMTGCANEVKEFEDERARLAQIAESNGDPQRARRRRPLTAQCKATLTDMVKTELFAHMLRAWSSALHGSLKPRERIVVKRETVIKIVLGRVKALFPPDYIKYSDISGLAYYDELDMTDNDFDPEPLPPSGPPVSAAGTGAAAKKKKASAAATSSSVVTLPAEKTSSAVPKSTTTAKRRRGSGDASSSVVVSALPTLPPPVPPGTPATTPASSLEPTPKRARPDPSLQPQQQRSPLVLPPRITHAPSPSLAARAAAAGGALTPIAARSSPLGTKSPLGASAALFPPPTSVAPSWAASPLPSLATTTSSLFGGTSSPRAVVVTAGGGRETTPPNLTTTRLAFPSPLMTTAKNALHSNGGSPPGSATTAAAAGVPMPVGPIAAALHATPPLALPATASMIATTTHGFSVPPPMQPIGGGGHKQPSA